MIPPKYNFYLSINSVDRISINPHYSKLSKKYSKENQQEFFRESLDGKITLFGKDYELVNEADIESTFTFLIEKYNVSSKVWYKYFEGEFSKTDCKFDHSKKSCELKINPLDDYTDILNSYENTYDIIKLKPRITRVKAHKRSLIQVYIAGANSITNIFGGTYWEEDVAEAVYDNVALQTNHHFAYIGVANEFYITDCKDSYANGVYAGTNGVYSKWNPGYTCRLEPYTESTELENPYTLNLYNVNGRVIYKSEAKSIPDTDDLHIGLSAFKMINVNDDTDTFIISTIFEYPIYMRLLCDVESITLSGEPVKTYVLDGTDFANYGGSNYRRCIGIDSGTVMCTSRTVSNPTRFGVDDYGNYFTNEFIPSSAGVSRPIPVSRNSWANASLWYIYDELSYNLMEQKLRKEFYIKDCWSIAEIIKALLGKIAPSIVHEANSRYSLFLYGATVPLDVARFRVYLTAKSNVLKSNYDQPAQKAETSLKEIMDMLRDCFRCYWFIEDGKFRIEHISYFNKGLSYYDNTQEIQLDFTNLKDMFNKKLIAHFQSEIEYEKDELAKRYEFGWMDDVTDIFGNSYADINSNYVQKDKNEEITVTNFTSDVDFMMFNQANFSQDGFALLCPITVGSSTELELPIITSTSVDDDGYNYSITAQNWYASWHYLINLYLYDMPAKYINYSAKGSLISQGGVKRCKKLNIEFPCEEDPDLYKLIKTEFGNGKIDEVSININTRLVEAKLSYEP